MGVLMNKLLEGIITDMVSNLVYYDRKEDEDLPCGEIERMIKDGELTIDEMVDAFKIELTRAV